MLDNLEWRYLIFLIKSIYKRKTPEPKLSNSVNTSAKVLLKEGVCCYIVAIPFNKNIFEKKK